MVLPKSTIFADHVQEVHHYNRRCPEVRSGITSYGPLEPGQDDCCGGGLWENENGTIILFARSFDFGAPDFSRLSRVDWNTLDGIQHPLVYYPSWPDRILAVPIIVGC